MLGSGHTLAEPYLAAHTQIISGNTPHLITLTHKVNLRDLNAIVSYELNDYHELSEFFGDERWIKNYWKQNFYLISANQTPLALTWQGIKIEGDSLWVFQEYDGAATDLEGASLHNKLIAGLYEQQFNQVQLSIESHQTELIFNEQYPVLRLY